MFPIIQKKGGKGGKEQSVGIHKAQESVPTISTGKERSWCHTALFNVGLFLNYISH